MRRREFPTSVTVRRSKNVFKRNNNEPQKRFSICGRSADIVEGVMLEMAFINIFLSPLTGSVTNCLMVSTYSDYLGVLPFDSEVERCLKVRILNVLVRFPLKVETKYS